MSGKVARVHPDRVISQLAGRRYGVLTRAQLLGHGLTTHQIEHRLETGRLVAAHRGVYFAGGSVVTVEGRWLAAVLACGPGAALSHLDAAALWELLPDGRGPVHVTVRNGRGGRRGITLHRAPLSAEVTERKGIPVTTPPRTLLDLSPSLPRRKLERAIDEATYLHLLPAGALATTLERNAGRTGVRQLRAVLATHAAGTTRTKSHLEELFLALCRRHRLPQPLVNARVEGLEVDFLWPAERLIVETDGFAAHGRRVAFERDHDRDLRLESADYVVRRFTYRQITADGAAVAAVVRRALG